MITKYSALPFTKKFKLKQASPRPPGHFQICFAYESLPNLNIKHHLVFGNEKKNCKTFNFFLNVIYFDAFFVIHVLHVIFFFSFFSSVLDVGMQSGGRGERDRSTQQNRPTSACITAYKSGSGGWGWVGGWRSEPKTKEDMYNHLCGQETERQPSDGL